MRSHRLASTTLAALAVAVLAAGCGSGRDQGSFLPDDQAPAAATPAPSAVPQVVVAGPKQAVLDQRDAAKADAAASRADATRAEAARKAAKAELREEREKTAKARRRAERREDALEQQLAAARAARREAAARLQAATPVAAPKPAAKGDDSAPIAASDVQDPIAERNARSDREARAAVVRFHELLDDRDARSCDLLTDSLLTSFYGADDALGHCRAAVEGLDAAVSVVIAESTTYGKASTIAVVTTLGDQQVPQTMRLVLQDGTWRIDAVERRDA